jgi:hypothetical protein
MDLSLRRVKRLLPDSEYKVVTRVVQARSLPPTEIARLRGLARGWRDKYVDRAHRQSREARGKGKPRSTRGARSNENTMRQADIMDWVLDRLAELEAVPEARPRKGDRNARPASRAAPSPSEIRQALSLPHVATFGDLWAEFPDTPVAKLRKALWALVEAGEAELATGGGIQLKAEEEVAYIEEVHGIGGVRVQGRAPRDEAVRTHRDHFARTQVVRIRAHKRARGARDQVRRDRSGGGGKRR